jgi:four helix bundle protein
MQDFRKLKVWEKAHQLTIGVYRATRGFPRVEQFGVTSQLRRASASIPANIAEGCGRGSPRELAQFLFVALGSTNEVEYHLVLARDLGYLSADSQEELEGQVAEVRRMLAGLVAKVRAGSRAIR